MTRRVRSAESIPSSILGEEVRNTGPQSIKGADGVVARKGLAVDTKRADKIPYKGGRACLSHDTASDHETFVRKQVRRNLNPDS